MSWRVVRECTVEAMQPVVDDAPLAGQYYTDNLATYQALNYHRRPHLVARGRGMARHARTRRPTQLRRRMRR